MKLKYVDKRGRYFPRLDNYPNGVTVNEGDEIKTTEKEAAGLFTIKNGKNRSFEEVKPKRVKPEIVEVEE